MLSTHAQKAGSSEIRRHIERKSILGVTSSSPIYFFPLFTLSYPQDQNLTQTILLCCMFLGFLSKGQLTLTPEASMRGKALPNYIMRENLGG